MKKIVSLFVTLLTFNYFVCGQSVYTDKKEYESAVKQYNDELDSYNNYISKINFYKNFIYPKSNSYPTTKYEWESFFRGKLESSGIRFDNHIVRLHENVTPSGKVYINFLESNNSNKLLVSITDFEVSNAIYSASTFKFNHPGKKPVFKEKTIVKEQKVIKKDTSLVLNSTTLVEEKVASDNAHSNLFLMPDGKWYTYYELTKMYPSMNFKTVLESNFPSNKEITRKIREIVYDNKKITEIIINDGKSSTFLRKVVYNWGGIYYYNLDNKTITEAQFYAALKN